jgi:hypothetical protein
MDRLERDEAYTGVYHPNLRPGHHQHLTAWQACVCIDVLLCLHRGRPAELLGCWVDVEEDLAGGEAQ